ncbi:3-carboxyethylcatechol 2,3-dioxygenase [Pseudomonas sp. S 311-6]|nr:3-carboxyethylcatechol 2,3-dioxygenase [Pseudomonas sp. S 311-6]
MQARVQCLSHTPLVGHVDPPVCVLDEVQGVIAQAREAIAIFDPELVVLFSPDHFNGFFYDAMPPFCIGMQAHAIGDFDTPAGPFDVPQALALDCAQAVLEAGVDVAMSYSMQVDHGFSQPLDYLLGGIAVRPVIPVFINAVAAPLPTFARARALGAAVGRFIRDTGKRTLFIGSGGLSHQPPVPELATADAHIRDRLLGSGRHLPAAERAARQQRVIDAALRFVEDQSSLHQLNPAWDRAFMDTLAQGRAAELDGLSNADVSRQAGKSTHEVKTWVAAFAALSAYGGYEALDAYYRPIPEWIAGFGALAARPLAA